MYTFTINGKTSWCEISDKQEMILKCLDVSLSVEPKKVQAKLKKKRGKKPRSGYALHVRTWVGTIVLHYFGVFSIWRVSA